MSFEVHEKVLNFFFFELKKEPMEGFSPVTLAQVAAADRELHVRLAEMTRAGFRPGPAGELPLDIHTEKILDGPELRWMLMPLPRKTVGKPNVDTAPAPKATPQPDPKRNRNEPSKKTRDDALRLKKLKRTPMPKKLEASPVVVNLRKRKATAEAESSLDGSAKQQKCCEVGQWNAEGHHVSTVPEVGTPKGEPFSVHQEVDAETLDGAKQPSQRNLFVLDLFCGTAGVTAALKSMGCDALGIDHMVDKRRVKGPVAKVDLSKKSGQSTVLQWIHEGKVDGVMLAPPCGTSSRAREIPIPRRLRLRSGMQPEPLRSDEHPMGLLHLRGVAKLKVTTANELYSFTRQAEEHIISFEF
eukprot:s5678_g6.t1